MKTLGAITAANKDLKVNVVEQPFADIFTKWQTDVLAGGGPDMYIAPNDNLFSQADAGALADLTAALEGKLEGFNQVAVDGSKVDLGQGAKMFMVPESLKAVAMWYDKSKVTAAPATTDELLAAVKSGAVTLGLNQNAYHNFGLSGAFGGTLMDDPASASPTRPPAGPTATSSWPTSRPPAPSSTRTATPSSRTSRPASSTPSSTARGRRRTSRRPSARTSPWRRSPPAPRKANPLTGTDGWYINPNSKNMDLAVKLALQLVGTASEQTMTNDAGHVPAAPGVTINSPIVQGFADAAAAGLPRPQRAEFNNYWGGFGDALNRVLDKGEDATAAIATACKTMNDANKK